MKKLFLIILLFSAFTSNAQVITQLLAPNGQLVVIGNGVKVVGKILVVDSSKYATNYAYRRYADSLHVITLASGGANNYPTTLTFNAGTRALTMGRNGLTTLAVNIPEATQNPSINASKLGTVIVTTVGDSQRYEINTNWVVDSPQNIPRSPNALMHRSLTDSLIAAAGGGGANNYPTTLTFNSGTRDLTLGRNGLASIAANIPATDIAGYLSALPGHGAGKMLVTTLSGYAWVDTPSSGGGVAITTPAAPTGGSVNDAANTFDWVYTSGYTTPSSYEQSLDGGSTITTVSAKPFLVGNVAIASGQVMVRVKAVSGVSNASPWLVSSSGYTIAGTFSPTIMLESNYAGSMLVSPAIASSTIATSLMYRKGNGPARNVLQGDTLDANYAVIPILDTAYAVGNIRVWDPAHPTDTAYNTTPFTSIAPSGSNQATNLFVVGDSHTSNGWQAALFSALNGSFTKSATGYPGQTLNAFLSDTAQLNPALRKYSAGSRNTAILEFGRNDASQSISVAVQMADRRKADSIFKATGFDYVLHVTTPPSRWSGLTQPGAENLRRAVNDSLRRFAGIDTNFKIVDFGGDPYVGNPDNTLNSLFYDTASSDRTHLTTLGYTYASGQALPVVLSLRNVSLAAPPVLTVGDTVEDTNSNIFASGPPNPVAVSSVGYTNGTGLYYSPGDIGYYEISFYGGGFAWRIVSGLSNSYEFVLDGDTLDFASRFVLLSGNDYATYGLPLGNHTLRVQSLAGAPGYTIWDRLIINNGQQFNTFLAPNTPIEETDPLWFFSGPAYTFSADVLYSGGAAVFATSVNSIAQLPFNGSSIDIYTPTGTLMEAWIDGVFVQNVTNSGAFVNVPASGAGNHVLKLIPITGNNAIIDKVEAQP